ncbi:MAG: hypothetical protein QXF26_04590 [Candidatus Bathyarchaeia archaeon]
MDPSIGRVAFNLAFLFLIMALIPLPFLDVNSAEFVVDTLALIISALFLIFVSWEVRRQVKKTRLKEEGT